MQLFFILTFSFVILLGEGGVAVTYGPSLVSLTKYGSNGIGPAFFQAPANRVLHLGDHPNYSVVVPLADASSTATSNQIFFNRRVSGPGSFIVQAPADYGVMAVINSLDLRTATTGCNDFIQFGEVGDGGLETTGTCGKVDNRDGSYAPSTLVGPRVFISPSGKMRVLFYHGYIWGLVRDFNFDILHPRRNPVLKAEISFTAYKHCGSSNSTLKSCTKGAEQRTCISSSLFCDRIIHCGFKENFGSDELVSNCVPDLLKVLLPRVISRALVKLNRTDATKATESATTSRTTTTPPSTTTTEASTVPTTLSTTPLTTTTTTSEKTTTTPITTPTTTIPTSTTIASTTSLKPKLNFRQPSISPATTREPFHYHLTAHMLSSNLKDRFSNNRYSDGDSKPKDADTYYTPPTKIPYNESFLHTVLTSFRNSSENMTIFEDSRLYVDEEDGQLEPLTSSNVTNFGEQTTDRSSISVSTIWWMSGVGSVLVIAFIIFRVCCCGHRVIWVPNPKNLRRRKSTTDFSDQLPESPQTVKRKLSKGNRETPPPYDILFPHPKQKFQDDEALQY